MKELEKKIKSIKESFDKLKELVDEFNSYAESGEVYQFYRNYEEEGIDEWEIDELLNYAKEQGIN